MPCKPTSTVTPPDFPPFKASRPECLVLWRRRLALTQWDAASVLEVPVDRIRRWEDGTAKHCPRSRVGRIRDYEMCYLLRRRAMHTQAELAALMKVTRLWLVAMEAGEVPVDRLRTYWAFRLSNQAL